MRRRTRLARRPARVRHHGDARPRLRGSVSSAGGRGSGQRLPLHDERLPSPDHEGLATACARASRCDRGGGKGRKPDQGRVDRDLHRSGRVPSLFGKPTDYARFLDAELQFVYSGRLLVVTPQGAALAAHGRLEGTRRSFTPRSSLGATGSRGRRSRWCGSSQGRRPNPAETLLRVPRRRHPASRGGRGRSSPSAPSAYWRWRAFSSFGDGRRDRNSPSVDVCPRPGVRRVTTPARRQAMADRGRPRLSCRRCAGCRPDRGEDRVAFLCGRPGSTVRRPPRDLRAEEGTDRAGGDRRRTAVAPPLRACRPGRVHLSVANARPDRGDRSARSPDARRSLRRVGTAAGAPPGRRLLDADGSPRVLDGRRWHGDPAKIPLVRHAQIVLELGGYVRPHPRYLFPKAL